MLNDVEILVGVDSEKLCKVWGGVMDYQIIFPGWELNNLEILTKYLDEQGVIYEVNNCDGGEEIKFYTDDEFVMGYVDTFIDFSLIEVS